MVATIGRFAAGVLGATLLLAAPASGSGIVDGVKTVGDLTIYLGIVPAAIVRGHAEAHTEARMHGGVPQARHNVHLVVALFNKSTGARVTDATVVATIVEPVGRHGKQWSVRLQPMTINGALTFGGYTVIEDVADYRVSVEVRRPPGAPRPLAAPARPVLAIFDYTHD